ncbi:hypothetical protein ACWGII_38615 [Streptomyces sp. NPDC054855]
MRARRPIPPGPHRGGVLGGAGGALGIGGLLTACGGPEGDAKSSGGGTGWSFEDHRVPTAKPAGRPRRIVAHIGAAAALTGNLQPDQLKKSGPTWAKLPAVKAGQVISSSNEAQFSHAGYAPLIEQLAAAVDKSKKAAA